MRKEAYFLLPLLSWAIFYQNCSNTSGCVDPENPMCGSSPSGAMSQSSTASGGGASSTYQPVGMGSGSSSGGSSNPGSLVFTKNLNPLNISDNGDGLGQGTLSVTVTGGKGYLTYKWYKETTVSGSLKSEVIANNLFYSNFGADLSINSRDYSVDGKYYVVVSDESGAQLTSQKVDVKVAEPNTGCAAGAYWASKVDPINSVQSLQSRFSNSRGAYLLHTRYLMGLTTLAYSVPAGQWGYLSLVAGTSGQLRTVNCSNFLPNLHEPADLYSFGWRGSITVSCQNDKWKLVTNTCKKIESTGGDVFSSIDKVQ